MHFDPWRTVELYRVQPIGILLAVNNNHVHSGNCAVIRVGEVTAVSGVKITLRIDDDSSKETLFYKGSKLKGVSIREHVSIQRGFRSIVCVVDGEYLDERRTEASGISLDYVRRIEVTPIGHFEGDTFKHGIKYLPMIKDPVFLLPEDSVQRIYGSSGSDAFTIGKTLKDDIPIKLPWQRLFNSHIGIFGNTGSGKSNTLAKLYTTLFESKAGQMDGKSRFVVLDFNGEYTGQQLVNQQRKALYLLSTQGNGGDRFPLHRAEFWDVDTLSVLFQATPNTQRPFLTRVVEGRAKFQNYPEALPNFIKSVFRQSFNAAKARQESLDLLRSIANLIGADEVFLALRDVSWHNVSGRFFRPSDGVWFDPDGQSYEAHLAKVVDGVDPSGLDAFGELMLRAQLQLARDVTYGFVQFEHIQPLLKRVEASISGLNKAIKVVGDDDYPPERLVTIVSLKRCSNELKKVLPLLLAKHYYNAHKDRVAQPPDQTLHLVVDEAHNILSQQSIREQESWKDYRLELFEEIIKEGRKFGVFVTISSQRPADISPTIVSQLHNFFVHRLVNDRDLFLIENTITTLDALSRSLIPSLSQGCCVITGTSFDLPVVIQVDPLKRSMRPDSEDVNLEVLWSLADDDA
jgi:uncharacterized protein